MDEQTENNENWIRFESKSRPGKFFLYNVLTKESRWSFESSKKTQQNVPGKSTPAQDRLKRLQKNLAKANSKNSGSEVKAKDLSMNKKLDFLSEQQIAPELRDKPLSLSTKPELTARNPSTTIEETGHTKQTISSEKQIVTKDIPLSLSTKPDLRARNTSETFKETEHTKQTLPSEKQIVTELRDKPLSLSTKPEIRFRNTSTTFEETGHTKQTIPPETQIVAELRDKPLSLSTKPEIRARNTSTTIEETGHTKQTIPSEKQIVAELRDKPLSLSTKPEIRARNTSTTIEGTGPTKPIITKQIIWSEKKIMAGDKPLSLSTKPEIKARNTSTTIEDTGHTKQTIPSEKQMEAESRDKPLSLSTNPEIRARNISKTIEETGHTKQTIPPETQIVAELRDKPLSLSTKSEIRARNTSKTIEGMGHTKQTIPPEKQIVPESRDKPLSLSTKPEIRARNTSTTIEGTGPTKPIITKQIIWSEKKIMAGDKPLSLSTKPEIKARNTSTTFEETGHTKQTIPPEKQIVPEFRDKPLSLSTKPEISFRNTSTTFEETGHTKQTIPPETQRVAELRDKPLSLSTIPEIRARNSTTTQELGLTIETTEKYASAIYEKFVIGHRNDQSSNSNQHQFRIPKKPNDGQPKNLSTKTPSKRKHDEALRSTSSSVSTEQSTNDSSEKETINSCRPKKTRLSEEVINEIIERSINPSQPTIISMIKACCSSLYKKVAHINEGNNSNDAIKQSNLSPSSSPSFKENEARRPQESANERLQRLRRCLQKEQTPIRGAPFPKSSSVVSSVYSLRRPNIISEEMDWEDSPPLNTTTSSSSLFNLNNPSNLSIRSEHLDIVNENLLRLAARKNQNKQLWKTDCFYIVVDTNVFLENVTFIDELTTMKLFDTAGTLIYIPYCVLQELDKLKIHSSSESIKTRSKRAIHFINKCLEKRSQNIQAQSSSDENRHLIKVTSPDDSILNCCLQVKQHIEHLMLLTEDINLRNKAMCSDILVSTKSDLISKHESLLRNE